MSDAPTTTAAPAAATEPTVVAAPGVESTTAAPATDAAAAATTETGPVAVSPEDKPADADAPAASEPKKDGEKVVELITEGQLALKGPGFVKSIIPSKKEFWLSDDAVAPQHLDSYMRGEKPEVSNPVVAWASQTGKGLLFFNKKGETKREHPHGVLPLYDATELKRVAPHEIIFKIHNQPYTLKAANDDERDGWFLSLEKAVELGKSQKETIRESEGYKAEIERLSKPNTGAVAAGAGAAGAGAAGVLRSKSKGKKEEEAKPVGSDGEGEKEKKARSTSRGVLGRFQRKKEEAKDTTAKETETPEQAAAEGAKKEETTEAPLDAQATAERAVGAPVEEKKDEPATEAPTVDTAAAAKTEEKPKQSKRGSIFGKVAGFGGIRSPTKEKEAKDAELKPEAGNEVSETAPQIPEPSTQTASEGVEAEKAEKAADAGETASPKEGKSNFLSAFIRRSRSVSPSQKLDEASLKKELESPEQQATTAATTTEGEAAPIAAAATTEAAPATTEAEKPAEEAAKETPNKRQSMLGNLGRRASKALKGIQAPKKENAALAAATAEKEEEKVAEIAPVAATETPAVNGETKAAETEKAQIGDVVPEAVNVGQPQQGPATVTASA